MVLISTMALALKMSRPAATAGEEAFESPDSLWALSLLFGRASYVVGCMYTRMHVHKDACTRVGLALLKDP